MYDLSCYLEWHADRNHTRKQSHAICRHFADTADWQPKKIFSQYREDGFEKDVTDARLLANECDASTEFAQKRNRKRKTFHDEVNAEQPGRQDAQLHFKQTVFYVIVNTISSEFNTRFENLGQISEKFRFILQMSEMSKKDLEESADVMQQCVERPNSRDL